MGRFQVIEYSTHFTVRDTHTGLERPMGDGGDTLFDCDGNGLSHGAPGFTEAWASALNADENETLAAYFPEQCERENGR